jgi:crotonobetainyl-CoA:carnitine CoA-transferase CaiB-like acyl-CoA transferase
VAEQFAAPGSAAHAAVEAIFAARTRAEWQAFAAEHECCLEPVLDLDEALSSELVRSREMVVGLDQPGVATPVRLLGAPVKLSRTPADCNRLPGPALGEHTAAVLRGAGYDDARIAQLFEAGAVAGPDRGGAGGAFRA